MPYDPVNTCKCIVKFCHLRLYKPCSESIYLCDIVRLAHKTYLMTNHCKHQRNKQSYHPLQFSANLQSAQMLFGMEHPLHVVSQPGQPQTLYETCRTSLSLKINSDSSIFMAHFFNLQLQSQ